MRLFDLCLKCYVDYFNWQENYQVFKKIVRKPTRLSRFRAAKFTDGLLHYL